MHRAVPSEPEPPLRSPRETCSAPTRAHAFTALSWILIAVVAVLVLRARAADDFFITYRYAWNLAHGDGFVYTAGERIFGTTEPGLGLVLALVHAVTRAPIPWIGSALYGACLGLVVWLVWRESVAIGPRTDSRIRRWGALLGGTLVLGSSLVWVHHGGGSIPSLALLAAAAFWSARRPGLAGALAGAAVWVRPDAGIGIGVLALLMLLDRRPHASNPETSPGLGRFLAGAAAVVGAGLLLVWLWFGAALPETLGAKLTMGEGPAGRWSGPEGFWARSVRFLPRHLGPGWLLVVAAGLAGLGEAVRHGGRTLRTVVLTGACLAVAYPLLGVPFFPWYAALPAVALLYGLAFLGVGIGATVADRIAGRPETARAGRPLGPALAHTLLHAAATALALALPLLTLVPATVGWFAAWDGYARYETFAEAGRWIEAHTASDAVVGAGEIGALGYYSRRPLFDLMGLVTREARPFVRAGDLGGAFAHACPDVFPHHPQAPAAGLPEIPWFRAAYLPAAVIEPPGGAGGHPVTVWLRRPGTSCPPVTPPEVTARSETPP